MILQLVNATPPDRSGLADYASKLQRHWPDSGERWAALAMRVPPGAEAAWTGVELHTLRPGARSLTVALESLQPKTLLLHFVPHAFDPSGVADWLVDGLEAWKRNSEVPLFAVFHELYVWADPWRRAALSIAPSKRCFRRLAALTDGWVVSNARYFREACKCGADGATGRIVPIGTNIEPCGASVPKRPEGGLKLVVFGLPASRIRAIRAHRRLLRALSAAGEVDRLTLIGVAPSPREAAITRKLIAPALAARTQTLYDADEGAISAALAVADVGLCAIEAPIATKSGVYAACCAHGLVPVVQGGPLKSTEPPFVGNDDREIGHVLKTLTDPVDRGRFQQAALEWSAVTGSWHAIAGALHDHLRQTCGYGVAP